MKLKKYFKKIETENAISNLKSEFAKDFGSLYKGPKEKLYKYVRSKPVKSFFIMIGILLINFIIVIYIDRKNEHEAPKHFSGFKEYLTNTPIIKSENTLPLSYSNLSAIKNISDSLAFYVNKSYLNKNDSVVLKRILKRYMELDPTAFKKSKK